MTPLDPQLQNLLAMTAGAELSFDLGERRQAYRTLLSYAGSQAQPPVEVAAVEEAQIDGGDGSLPARIYRPEGSGPFPTIVFFHGGGFTIGDVEAYDFQCRTLCRDVGAVVLSVEYRLAPEHPFPAAVDDALAATRWAALEISQLGGDPHRLAVAGDSAGGNLSAVVSQQLRDEGGPRLAAQLLLYPATDFTTAPDSLTRNGEGYLLDAETIGWFGANYVDGEADLSDPRLSPALGDLSGLPPAIVATAEYDPLVDFGDAYAEALEAAGNRVIHRRFDGLIHVFFGLGPLSEGCAQATATVCADLRELLG